MWTTPSDLALFALAIQGALAGKPGAIVSASTAREMLRPVLGFYALGFAIAGNGPIGIFPTLERILDTCPSCSHMRRRWCGLAEHQQYSKALMLEIIQALSKQYGWTEFPTESTFSNPCIMA